MKILALECSSLPASVAIIENEKILGSSFINIKLTHSQTLIPMVNDLLSATMLTIQDIDGIAITAGPGSFTGIRIGISAVKGLAFTKNTPCVAVSTLLAMAQNFIGNDCYVCAVMDARCKQLYNAIFEIKNKKIIRLCDDRAISCEQLKTEIEKLAGKAQENIIICGDGSDIFMEYVENISNVKIATQQYKFQNAAAVGLLAYEDFVKGNTISHEELLPIYLRLPQAERELKEKLNLEVK